MQEELNAQQSPMLLKIPKRRIEKQLLGLAIQKTWVTLKKAFYWLIVAEAKFQWVEE